MIDNSLYGSQSCQGFGGQYNPLAGLGALAGLGGQSRQLSALSMAGLVQETSFVSLMQNEVNEILKGCDE